MRSTMVLITLTVTGMLNSEYCSTYTVQSITYTVLFTYRIAATKLQLFDTQTNSADYATIASSSVNIIVL
jgi:hypothetical protein